ncbi:MAG: hypothetical protein AABW81_03175 [Nanoarchaeota archaeon]
MDKESCKGSSAQHLEHLGRVAPYCKEYQNCKYASKEQEFVEGTNVRECGYGRIISPKPFVK